MYHRFLVVTFFMGSSLICMHANENTPPANRPVAYRLGLNFPSRTTYATQSPSPQTGSPVFAGLKTPEDWDQFEVLDFDAEVAGLMQVFTRSLDAELSSEGPSLQAPASASESMLDYQAVTVSDVDFLTPVPEEELDVVLSLFERTPEETVVGKRKKCTSVVPAAVSLKVQNNKKRYKAAV